MTKINVKSSSTAANSDEGNYSYLFLDQSTNDRFSFASVAGILPESRLRERVIEVKRFEKFPNDSGIAPVSTLPSSVIPTRLGRTESDAGSTPESLL